MHGGRTERTVLPPVRKQPLASAAVCSLRRCRQATSAVAAGASSKICVKLETNFAIKQVPSHRFVPASALKASGAAHKKCISSSCPLFSVFFLAPLH